MQNSSENMLLFHSANGYCISETHFFICNGSAILLPVLRALTKIGKF